MQGQGEPRLRAAGLLPLGLIFCMPSFLPSSISTLSGFPHLCILSPILTFQSFLPGFILCASHLGLTLPKDMSKEVRVPYLHSGYTGHWPCVATEYFECGY